MTAAVEPPAAEPASPSPPGRVVRSAAPSQADWLVSPAFDLLLVANLFWPLLPLAEWLGGVPAGDGIRFWQVYFVTTPHRWVTLALVFLDPERRRERPFAFPLVAAAVTAACGGVWLATGTLTCLLAIDYVWNAWHFAAQHHGIYRIYGRKAQPNRTRGLTAEKWLMRAFVVYVAARVAGWGWSYEAADLWLRRADWAAALIPAYLVVRELRYRLRPAGRGRLAYLISFSTLYSALLWAVRANRPAMVLALATASAAFHATEYLAVVSWTVRGHRAADGSTLWARIAGEWGLSLAAFAAVLGACGWLADSRALRAWLFVNVVVAFLHYAYDGMIWKRGAARGAAA